MLNQVGSEVGSGISGFPLFLHFLLFLILVVSVFQSRVKIIPNREGSMASNCLFPWEGAVRRRMGEYHSPCILERCLVLMLYSEVYVYVHMKIQYTSEKEMNIKKPSTRREENQSKKEGIR